jgi:hypothetical protein
MKDVNKKSPIPSIIFTFITITIGATFGQASISYGQAVDLIPIQTGNTTLDRGLPEFYDCIEEKIDASKGVEADPYFEKEPTKHEVSTCYNEIFVKTNEVDSSETNEVDSSETNEVDSSETNEVDSSETNEVDSSETPINSDIARFNSLFGVMG